MGRSPFYTDYVKPLAQKDKLQLLDDIFCYFFAVGDISSYDDGTLMATTDGKTNNKLYIRIIKWEHTPSPLLERSCSVYQKMEDRFPEPENIYEVLSAIKYCFQNKHSGNKPFTYHVLELRNTNHRFYTTFCIKTDGALLNLESLTVRGYVSQVVMESSTKQLSGGR